MQVLLTTLQHACSSFTGQAHSRAELLAGIETVNTGKGGPRTEKFLQVFMCTLIGVPSHSLQIEGVYFSNNVSFSGGPML